MLNKPGNMQKWFLIALTLIAIVPLVLFSISCSCDDDSTTRQQNYQRMVFEKSSLENQKKQLQEQQTTQTNRIQTLQAELTTLKTQTQTAQADTTPVQKEADSLQQTSASSQTQMNSIDQKIQNTQAEIDQANKQLAATQQELKIVQARIDVLTKGGGGSYSSSCFDGDTLVLMADNSLKKIRDVQTGELVWSYDTETKQMVAAEVVETGNGESNYHFLVNSNLKLTPPHPFYTTEGQWVKVENLRVGDTIKSNTGTVEIDSIELLDSGIQIFHIYIKDYQNFFVSADGVTFYLVREQ